MRVIPTRVGKAEEGVDTYVEMAGHPHASGESYKQGGRLDRDRGSSPREWGKPLRSIRRHRWSRVIPTRVGKAVRPNGQSYSAAGHPHASGESSLRIRKVRLENGSSPREWGKPSVSKFPVKSIRVIPTRVGKALRFRTRLLIQSGHPHASGESIHYQGHKTPGTGSSPREWGKRFLADFPEKLERVIPTRVGKAARGLISARFLTGHPHASGESSDKANRFVDICGSSPREWGKLFPGVDPWCRRRVIPTRVGKAWDVLTATGITTGHPHASGESSPPSGFSAAHTGSSPREWGKPSGTGCGRKLPRVIPTRVGKAMPDSSFQSVMSGHPHASGESRDVDRAPVVAAGSSPREWGKPLPLIFRLNRLRVIPTRVGKALRGDQRIYHIPGHPHASGESYLRTWPFTTAVGSSPREWGKLDGSGRSVLEMRVIPTRVGKAFIASPSASSTSGHPHASGESSVFDCDKFSLAGSSPREWGKLAAQSR